MIEAIQRALSSVQFEQVYHPDLGVQERVLAYELYHQLRCMESEGELEIVPARLQAELDKRAQAYFGDGEATPDLLVHSPGDNNANLLVLELKRIARGRAEAEADLRKLAKFVRDPLEYARRCLVLCCESDRERERAAVWVQSWDNPGPVQIDVVSFDARNGWVTHESVGWEETPITI